MKSRGILDTIGTSQQQDLINRLANIFSLNSHYSQLSCAGFIRKGLLEYLDEKNISMETIWNSPHSTRMEHVKAILLKVTDVMKLETEKISLVVDQAINSYLEWKSINQR